MLPYVHTCDLTCVHVKFMRVKGCCYASYSSKIIIHHSDEVLCCLSVRLPLSAEWCLFSTHCVFSNLFWFIVQSHCHLGQHWIVDSLLWHLFLSVASDSSCPGYVRRGKTVQAGTTAKLFVTVSFCNCCWWRSGIYNIQYNMKCLFP